MNLWSLTKTLGWRSPAVFLVVSITLLTGVLSCGGDEPDDKKPDRTRPTVVSTSPVDGDSTVSVDIVIGVTFSEPMDAAAMVAGVLTLDPPAAGVTGYSNRILTFTPSSALDTNITYAATVNTSVRDTAGNTLAAPFVWHFSTYRDTIPPTVVSTVPSEGDTVTVNTAISAVFSEPMDASTITSSSFHLTPLTFGAVSVLGDTQAFFTPEDTLDTFVTYTATITTAARDSAGNGLAQDYTWQFYTDRDRVPPVAEMLSPKHDGVIGDSVLIRVNASDNDRMSHVEFYIDDLLVPAANDSAAPYQYVWRPSGLTLGTEHTVYCMAYDASGNFSNSDTVTVHYLWRQLGVDDNNEAIPRNLARLYYRTGPERISFRVETWNGWGDYKSPTEGIDVVIFLDTDQDSTTGDRRTGPAGSETEMIGDIGADYKIVVGNHGDSLNQWNGSAWARGTVVDGLVISNSSNFFEVSVSLARLVDPQFIDLITAGVVIVNGALVWDWAPNVNLGHVTATVDKSYSGAPFSGPTERTEMSGAASTVLSPFD